jgi:hypothetical protein
MQSHRLTETTRLIITLAWRGCNLISLGAGGNGTRPLERPSPGLATLNRSPRIEAGSNLP